MPNQRERTAGREWSPKLTSPIDDSFIKCHILHLLLLQTKSSTLIHFLMKVKKTNKPKKNTGAFLQRDRICLEMTEVNMLSFKTKIILNRYVRSAGKDENGKRG